MKYGKTLLETLESVPEEWRQQAIEYRKVRSRRSFLLPFEPFVLINPAK